MLEIKTGNKTLSQRISEVPALQDYNKDNRLNFGVRFLDDALQGILPNDLILLTAKSGYGKTQLATHIAKNVVASGKKVGFFALEAFENEIEARMMYQILADAYFDDPHREYAEINWRSWIYGDEQTRKILSKYQNEVDYFAKKYEGLSTFYRTQREFTVDDFVQKYNELCCSCDLVIVDHLNYFDLIDPDQNQNQQVSAIAKKIRDEVLTGKTPVILLAHVRKSNDKKKLIPGMEDLHGSSDIYKNATKFIAMGRLNDTENQAPNVSPTLVQVLKDRYDGSSSRYTALISYIVNRQRFQDSYQLGKLTGNDDGWKELEEGERPFWMTTPKPRDIGT